MLSVLSLAAQPLLANMEGISWLICVACPELSTAVLSSRSERIGANNADAAAEDGCEPDAAAAAQRRAVMAGAIFQVSFTTADHAVSP
jgi:hypothetical protein